MDRHTFESIVHETIRTLPPQFREAIADVIIMIKPHPAPRRGRVSRSLLGLYEGIPVTAWGRDHSGKLPDMISLFQENIERAAASPDEVPHIIRETLLHEIAHHFGFDHDRIHDMEERWRKRRI